MNKEKIGRFHSDNILEAADILFKKQGFEKTTIEQIAKKAEYSKPTLYAYFTSKEEIYAVILYRYMLEFSDEFSEILGSDAPVLTTYLDCCHAVLRLKTDYPVYFYGVIGSTDFKTKLLSEDRTAAIGEIGKTINTKICQLFSRAVCEGIIDKNTDIKFAYSYIWSCVIGIVNSQKLRFDYPDSDEYRRVLDKSFLKIIEGFKIR